MWKFQINALINGHCDILWCTHVLFSVIPIHSLGSPNGRLRFCQVIHRAQKTDWNLRFTFLWADHTGDKLAPFKQPIKHWKAAFRDAVMAYLTSRRRPSDHDQCNPSAPKIFPCYPQQAYKSIEWFYSLSIFCFSRLHWLYILFQRQSSMTIPSENPTYATCSRSVYD